LSIAKVMPREQAGRDTFARYKAQIRSASIASLAILKGDVDRVYCDVHDDFVVRYNIDGEVRYVFFQVKTNGRANSNWTIKDLLGVSSAPNSDSSKKKVRDSFFGKMLSHTVNFGEQCKEVVFQTNINLADGAEDLVVALESYDFTMKLLESIAKNFCDIFELENRNLSIDEIKECLSKLRVESDIQYIKPKNHRFESYVSEEVYKYSEIELSQKERELIILKLLDLVSEKSSGVISDFNESCIESDAAISIKNLLEVLSLSYAAYEELRKGGDEKAVKNTSLLQRAFKQSSIDDDQLMYCTSSKVKWDNWLRKGRHGVPGEKIIRIKTMVNDEIDKAYVGGVLDFNEMMDLLEGVKFQLSHKNMLFDLSMDHLVGAFLSEWSKGQ